MKTFSVDGHLFRVTENGDVQYFIRDFNNANQLGEISGFFKSIGKIFKKAGKIIKKVALPVAAGATIYYGVKSAGGVANLIPSASTISKAAGIAAAIYTAKSANTQNVLEQQYGQQPVETVLTQQQNPQNNYGLPSGYAPKLNTQTLLIAGAGVLVLFLALRKK